MSDARGEGLEILNDAVEGGAAGEHEQRGLRRACVGVGVGRGRATEMAMEMVRVWRSHWSWRRFERKRESGEVKK